MPNFNIGSHRAAAPAPAPAPTHTWARGGVGPQKQIVYSPFSVADAGAERLLGTSWAPHGKYEVRRHGDSPHPLAFLNPETMMYIVSHCGPGGTVVQDNNRNQLTASELAARIKSDGLSLHHRTIKLYACSGGAGGADGTPSFASQLLAHLKALGYDRLQLFAYLTTLYSLNGQTGAKFALTPSGTARTRASNVRVQV